VSCAIGSKAPRPERQPVLAVAHHLTAGPHIA
jgi:hypothetical protein